MSNIGQKYYTIVSNKGKQAVIKALANKELIDLTTMSVGDGENPIDTNWESLPNEKDKFGITQIKIVDNITLEVTGILSASKGGYMIRQAGLYTSDNILFAIAQLPQTAKPVLSDGASKDMTIKFVITIADTSVVNLSIDPNINIITQNRLDEVIELNTNELRVEIDDKVDALKQETTTNLATKADKSVTYTKTEVNNLVNAKANATATVNLTGNQNINGVKTFLAPPVSATQPTNNNQLANKAYVDSVSGGIPDYSAGVQVSTAVSGSYTAPSKGLISYGSYIVDGTRVVTSNTSLTLSVNNITIASRSAPIRHEFNNMSDDIYIVDADISLDCQVPVKKGDVINWVGRLGCSVKFFPFN